MLNKETIGQYLYKEQMFLTSFAWYITADFQASEDLFQDLVVKALTSNESFGDFTQLRRWSTVVVKHAALNWLRDRNKYHILVDHKVLEALAHDWPNADEQNYRVPLEVLSQCVKKLNARNQRLVQLRYVQGLSSGDIAKQLKRKVETIYQAITRVHFKLRGCIKHQLAQEGEL